VAASLLLGGQLAYIAVTQLHAGGHANEHHEIFETYAHNQIWGAVHLGQFGSMASLLGGLIALAFVLDIESGSARWFSRLGAAAAAATLALYGALQAVDGVALKQAVTAWASAPQTEQAARFAAAESVRWLEWGMRSYQDFAFGLALVLFGASVLASQRLPRALGPVIGLSGAAYLAQGWIAGAEGFSSAQSVAIVLGWAFSLVWMIWLAVAAWLVAPLRLTSVVGARNRAQAGV
jgi:hypothetical protein